MKKEIVAFANIHPPETAFNHVIRAGDFLFLTSQISVDLKTGKILGGDIVTQTRQALNNVKFLLESCGTSMDQVVKVILYLRKAADRQKVNEVYREYFTKGQEPAKVTVQAPSPIAGIDIEIEVTAVMSS